jgi:O-antigen/teichoic acid export membrane protein
VAADLRRRTVRGGVTVAAVQVAQFVLTLASTAVLARLLAPGDFGLIAMAAAASQFLLLFRDLGLSAATVQRAELTQADVNSLFWINATLGLAIGALLAAFSPLIARFYGQAEIRGVLIALAFGVVVVGTSVQHSALLRREMRFTAVAMIELSSQAAGLVVAIAMAGLGWRYWALVGFQLVQNVVAAAGVWLATGWRPNWPTVRGARPMLSFGAGLTVFNVLTYAVRNLDNVLLGYAAGATALGFYSKAYSLLLLPIDRVRSPLSAVVVPALSRLQHDALRFRSYFLSAITTIAAAGMPAVVFLFVLADQAILIVLGPRWEGSVILFRILAPAAFVETFNTVGSWSCLPRGRAGRLVRWQMFATIVMAAAFLVGVRWGAVGLAAAVSISTVALRLPAMFYLLNDDWVRPTDVLAALYRPAAASIVAGLTVALLRREMADLQGASLLMFAAPAFASVYVALLFVLPGGARHFAQLLSIAREVFPFGWASPFQVERRAELGR